jgi:regulatory protein
MKISSISKIRSKKGMFRIFLDNEESFILTAETIVKFGLKEGLELGMADFEAVSAYDKSNRVMADALALVAKRSYSAKNLEEKLQDKGYEPENAKRAVKRLQELNYIDDSKYSKMLAKYLAGRAKGEYAIKAGLEKAGISKDLAKEAVENVKSEEEPYKQIIKVMKSKFKKFDPKDKNETRRIAAFFLRRGFTSENVAKAFREYKNIFLEDNY